MEMKRDAASKTASTKQAQSIVPQATLDPVSVPSVSWLTIACGENVVQLRAYLKTRLNFNQNSTN